MVESVFEVSVVDLGTLEVHVGIPPRMVVVIVVVGGWIVCGELVGGVAMERARWFGGLTSRRRSLK